MNLLKLSAMPSGDRVLIEDLRLQARVGVYPSEKGREQAVDLSLEIGLPSVLAFRSDDVAHTVDYTAVVEALGRLAVSRHFNLVEFLAEEIARAILDDFDVTWVVVRLRKVDVVPGARFVGVAILRKRGLLRRWRSIVCASSPPSEIGLSDALVRQVPAAAAMAAFREL